MNSHSHLIETITLPSCIHSLSPRLDLTVSTRTTVSQPKDRKTRAHPRRAPLETHHGRRAAGVPGRDRDRERPRPATRANGRPGPRQRWVIE
jgi:hypothetical protein